MNFFKEFVFRHLEECGLEVPKNNKTRFFFVLYSDKTWVSDQSERTLGPIYVIKTNNS